MVLALRYKCVAIEKAFRLDAKKGGDGTGIQSNTHHSNFLLLHTCRLFSLRLVTGRIRCCEVDDEGVVRRCQHEHVQVLIHSKKEWERG